MTNTNITSFRKNIFSFVDQAVTYGEVINVNTKNGNAVLLSEEDYSGIMETLYLVRLSEHDGDASSLRDSRYGREHSESSRGTAGYLRPL